MSQYVNFFIREPNTSRYIPIGSYSRSNKMFEVMSNYVPYEKVTALTEGLLTEIIAEIDRDTVEIHHLMDKEERNIERAQRMEGTFEERMEYISDCQSCIEDCEDNLDEYLMVRHQLQFLLDMIDDIHYSNRTLADESLFHGPRPGYIYAGIEVGEVNDSLIVS